MDFSNYNLYLLWEGGTGLWAFSNIDKMYKSYMHITICEITITLQSILIKKNCDVSIKTRPLANQVSRAYHFL